MKNRKILKMTMLAVAVMCLFQTVLGACVMAAELRFSVSPMQSRITLNPGETFESNFKITNPGTSTADIVYDVALNNFYVDENYNTVHEEYGNTGEILSWITFISPTHGALSPNESDEVRYRIDVPSNAPAGGQYAAFTVTASRPDKEKQVESEDDGGLGTAISESFAIDHLLFAEVVGKITRQGEIISADIPGFLLSGDITGSSSIKNTGSSHGIATYTLQVFPLFSDEEVYTNEENPETHIILPNRTLYDEIAWDNTPAFGIFNVIYTIEFEGITEQVSKLVIKCPIWLLFIIFFVIAALIIWLVMRARARGKSQKSSKASTEARPE